MSTGHSERRYAHLRALVDRKLASIIKNNNPRDLMQGSRYVLNAPGKRIRSIIVILSCEAVGGQMKDALDAAAAIEMLHNFTLVHDDVMDNAPSRRGRPTVHTKWDLNNAILVGDVILGFAYNMLLQSRTSNIRRVARLFTESFVAVCIGQALDIEYESRENISLREYYRMIGKKTGTLIATAAELGATLGNGSPRQIAALRMFGKHIGRAFQIQDDLLDTVADEKHLGKQIGGDIIEGKKTFLVVNALKRARGKDKDLFHGLMSGRGRSMAPDKQRALVRKVTSRYEKYGIIEAARREIRNETAAGIRKLRMLPASNAQAMLQWISKMLVERTY